MDRIKDWIADFLRWLTRNETWKEKMNTIRFALSGTASRVRFILALVSQCPSGLRNNYKRVSGPVKGTWFATEARKRTEQDISGTTGPVIYFIHGGAFLSGNTKMWSQWANDVIKAYFARSGKHMSMFFIDYTLVPDACFPTQPNECLSGLDYLVRQLNIDPSRLFIAGDSAGANLALQTLFESTLSSSLAGTILFSPWGYPCMSLIQSKQVEDRRGRMLSSTNSWFTNAENDYTTESFGLQGIKGFIKDTMSYSDACENAQINPFLRTEKEILSLPDIFCIYGEGECLRDQIDTWVETVKDTGKNLEVVRHPGGVHDWPLLPEYAQVSADYGKCVGMVAAWVDKKTGKAQ